MNDNKSKRSKDHVYNEAWSRFQEAEENYEFLEVKHPPRWRPKGPLGSWKTGQRAGEPGVYVNQYGQIETVQAYSPFIWAETPDGFECGYWKLVKRLPAIEVSI